MALLAMNVSKEVLNSFIIINGAIENTNNAFTAKNAQTLGEFEKQNSLNPEKVGDWYQKAQNVMNAGNQVYDSIADLKRFLIWKSGKAENIDAYVTAVSDGRVTTYSPEVDSLFSIKKIEAKDTYDAPTSIMIGSDPANLKEGPRTATDLHAKLEDFSAKVLSEHPSSKREDFRSEAEFDFSDIVIDNAGKKEPWEMANFYHVPLAAVITNLSRMQSEIRTIQSGALNILMSEISAKDFKFDKVEAKVIANSNYITLGDSFKADIIVAAYSTTDNPGLRVGTELDTAGKAESEWAVKNPLEKDDERMSVKEGIAHYGYKPTSEGEVKWGGFIVLKEPGTNKEKLYPFEHTFIAAKPSTVVSPTKMNVVYRALENPIEVSVSGYAATKIDAQTTNGSLTKVSPGKYILKPGKGKECKISVSVKDENGGAKSLGEGFKFRVKDVPAPEPTFAGISGTGKAKSSKLKVSQYVLAKMKDFDFDGVKWDVISFELLGSNNGQLVPPLKSRSNKVTSKMKSLLGVQRKGDRLFIQNIKARGPGGVEKVLPSIIIEVQ
jgi:gliding motility-associated protein GldM